MLSASPQRRSTSWPRRPRGTKAADQGLEIEFLAEFERVLPLIQNSPASFSRVLDLPADLVIRRALLPRFPYGAVFMDLGTEIRVLAVAHAKRQPGYWLNRVET